MAVTCTTSEFHSKTWKLSSSFEADLRKAAEVDLETEISLDLPGRWALYGAREVDKPSSVIFGVHWRGTALGCIGSAGSTLKYRLHAERSQHSTIIVNSVDKDGAWPYLVSGRTVDLRVTEKRLLEHHVPLDTQRAWRLEVEISTADARLLERAKVSEAAAHVNSTVDCLVTNDIRLYFPKTELELWTISQLLRTSPFFTTLFDSGFAEASLTRKRRRTKSGSSPEMVNVGQDDVAFEDSDDEADDIYIEQGRSFADPGEADYREIRISATAYATYRPSSCGSARRTSTLLRSPRPSRLATRQVRFQMNDVQLWMTSMSVSPDFPSPSRRNPSTASPTSSTYPPSNHLPLWRTNYSSA